MSMSWKDRICDDLWGNVHPADFQHSQWKIPRKVYIAYRSSVFTYWAVITILHFSAYEDKAFYFIYLSNLDQLCIFVYLGLALACSVIFYGKGRKTSVEERVTCLAEGGPPKEKRAHQLRRDLDKPTLVHKITLTAYVVCFNVAFTVTVLYPLLEGIKFDRPYDSFNFMNINIHLVNFLIMFFDLVLTRLAANPSHCLFVSVFSLAYACLLLMLHFTGANSAVYDAINYRDGAIKAGIITAAMVLVAPMISHTVMCSLQLLKKFTMRLECLSNKCTKSSALVKSESAVST